MSQGASKLQAIKLVIDPNQDFCIENKTEDSSVLRCRQSGTILKKSVFLRFVVATAPKLMRVRGGGKTESSGKEGSNGTKKLIIG